MISHLGRMLSLVVGATWTARRQGEDVFGLTVIGDGGSSTGEFHEALNLASVPKVAGDVPGAKQPLFLLHAHQRCNTIAGTFRIGPAGYGIFGRTIDGTDAWGVYTTSATPSTACGPTRCRTHRMHGPAAAGHAAYDKADYVESAAVGRLRRQDPLPKRPRALKNSAASRKRRSRGVNNRSTRRSSSAVARALEVPRPMPHGHSFGRPMPRAAGRGPSPPGRPGEKRRSRSSRALDYILANQPESFLMGLDIGIYGSAFKTCKGLMDSYGADRVIDCRFANRPGGVLPWGLRKWGASRSWSSSLPTFGPRWSPNWGSTRPPGFTGRGAPAPLVLRFPCGGGLTMGAFHSRRIRGALVAFPGLKASLSRHGPGMLRSRSWRASTTAIRAWFSSTSCFIGASRATSILTAIWPACGGRGVTPRGRYHPGGHGGDGTRGPGRGRPLPG